MKTRSDPRGHRRWRQARARVLAASTICWLCGRDGADSVDHVTPLHSGGELLEPGNLRPAHLGCNASRGAKPAQSVTIRSREW